MEKTTARGLVIKDNKILLMYREKNGKQYYSIPGGKIERGETLEQTVIREVLEETTIHIRPIKLLGNFENEDKQYFHNLFLCEYLNGEPKLGQAIEMEIMQKNPSNFFRPEWFDLEKVESLTIKPTPMESFVKKYILNL